MSSPSSATSIIRFRSPEGGRGVVTLQLHLGEAEKVGRLQMSARISRAEKISSTERAPFSSPSRRKASAAFLRSSTEGAISGCERYRSRSESSRRVPSTQANLYFVSKSIVPTRPHLRNEIPFPRRAIGPRRRLEASTQAAGAPRFRDSGHSPPHRLTSLGAVGVQADLISLKSNPLRVSSPPESATARTESVRASPIERPIPPASRSFSPDTIDARTAGSMSCEKRYWPLRW